ncbi:MAG: type II toxin-antitoxin system YafQ family toxin [Bacteroidales bacterium]|nr:type II toxin-antitoxin system YafQ family toxin [Bacteroidales bacterium]
MYKLTYSNKFKKSLKKCEKRGLNVELLRETLNILVETGTLPSKYRPHKLVGKYAGAWECHITPDWLLVWEQYDDELLLLLIDTGSHSDLF